MDVYTLEQDSRQGQYSVTTRFRLVPMNEPVDFSLVVQHITAIDQDEQWRDALHEAGFDANTLITVSEPHYELFPWRRPTVEVAERGCVIECQNGIEHVEAAEMCETYARLVAQRLSSEFYPTCTIVVSMRLESGVISRYFEGRQTGDYEHPYNFYMA